MLLLCYGILRERNTQAEIPSQLNHFSREVIVLGRDISASDAEIEAHTLDSRKVAESTDLLPISAQEDDCVLRLLAELFKSGFTHVDIDTGLFSNPA